MKKIIKPVQREEIKYIEDFSHEEFPYNVVPVEITIDCGYGSNHDPATYKFHLNGENGEKILQFIINNCIDKNLDSHEI